MQNALNPQLRTRFILLAILFLQKMSAPCSTAAEALAPLQRAPIIIAQGEQRVVRIPDLKRFSIGSPILRALPLQSKETLLLKGISPGITDLLVWKQDGSFESRSVQVVKISREEIPPALLKGLTRLSEAEVLFTGKGVVLRGEIQTMNEAAILSGLNRLFADQIQDETELSESLLQAGSLRLQNWLSSSRLSTKLRIEKIGAQLWVRGSTETPEEKSALQRKARAVFAGVQTDIEALPDHAPTVYFRVYLLEIKRNHFHSLGLSWPQNIQDAFRVTTGAIQSSQQINLALQNLEGTGHGRILSKPELVVRAPGEAELFAGGELPIQMQNRYFSNVTWKNYGLTLKLKVSNVTGERIRLDIFTEVSHLDSNISQDRIPGFQSNRMKTQVDARFGVPLLLSGLLQQGLREEVKGLPFLRNLPVLGLLFGSEDYLNEQSELVAILYPHSTPPVVPTGSVESRFRSLPKGRIPPPRNWISPSEERELRDSKEYPWNALE